MKDESFWWRYIILITFFMMLVGFISGLTHYLIMHRSIYPWLTLVLHYGLEIFFFVVCYWLFRFKKIDGKDSRSMLSFFFIITGYIVGFDSVNEPDLAYWQAMWMGIGGTYGLMSLADQEELVELKKTEFDRWVKFVAEKNAYEAHEDHIKEMDYKHWLKLLKVREKKLLDDSDSNKMMFG